VVDTADAATRPQVDDARSKVERRAARMVDAATAPIAKSRQSRAEYRPDIDGIRGAAAIMVMGFHAKVPGFEGAYIGLDLFFVVSGYVITGLLMHEYEKTGRIRWGAFYARRARRLIPAKATMLVVVLIASYFLLAPTGTQQQTAKSAAAAAGFVSNFFFLQASDDVQYFALAPGNGVLLHTWSLSVEEQFYLALPLALLLSYGLARLLRVPPVRTLLLTAVVLAVASSWLAITLATSDPDAAYYLPVTRAFEFLIGVALALVVRRLTLPEDVRELMGVVGLLLIAYCLWRPLPSDGYPSYWALIPCAAALLLTWAGTGGPTLATRILSVRFLVGLGLVSYGWYLWHWPLLVIGESVNLTTPPLLVRVGLVLAALGIAYVSYRTVEAAFYRRSGTPAPAAGAPGAGAGVAPVRRPPWPSRRILLTGVLAMSCVAGLAGAGLAAADDEQQEPRWQAVSAQLVDVPDMPEACLGDADFIPARPVKCELNEFVPGRPTVVLWGDSHAWMYIPALEAAVTDRDVNLVAFVMGSCPPYTLGPGEGGSCAANNRLALSYVTRMADRKAATRVILSGAWDNYLDNEPATFMQNADANPGRIAFLDQISEEFREGAPPLFEELGRLGIDVDVVGPTATIARNAPLCEARTRPFSCDVPRSSAISHEDETLAYLQRQMRWLPRTSNLIDVTPAVCDDDTCFAASGDVVNYIDDNHLSATLARRLVPYFEPTVEAVSPQGGRVTADRGQPRRAVLEDEERDREDG